MDWLTVLIIVLAILSFTLLDPIKRSKPKKMWKPGELEVRGGSEIWVVMESKTLEIVYRSEEQDDCWRYIKEHTDWKK